MKKILFTIALLLAIGQGAWAQTEVSSDAELRSAIDNADYSQGQMMKVKLTEHIKMESLLDIKPGYNVQLDLNGCNLYRQGLVEPDRNGQIIWVEAGGTLEIMNGSTAQGYVYGGYAYDGGGIWNDGTLTINGGWIWKNQVKDEDGTRGRGAGIYNSEGATLNFNGGIISENVASGKAHGGAGIFNEGTMTITGGLISHNHAADGHGGGIKNYGTLNMQGAPEVTYNDGGDVWLGVAQGANTRINVTGSLGGNTYTIGIQMEHEGVFTNGFNTNYNNPFFANKTLNEIGSDGSELRERIGYYECTWDETDKEVKRTLKHVEGDVTYLTGGKDANIGEGMTDSWYVVEGNIEYSHRVWCYNNVHIILLDNSHLEIGNGLKVFDDASHNATLKIYSRSYGNQMGKLTGDCSGIKWDDSKKEAGIGSVQGTKMGAVEIHGGNIVANGGNYAAGLGGGEDANSGTITIYDGIVTAKGGISAAGIGGGYGGSSEVTTIYGGTVTATGGEDAAGIGGGRISGGGGSNGTLTIWDGTITAYGGLNAPGIGAGHSRNLSSIINHGGDIIINGGHVTAYASKDAAAIGGASRSKGANVTINGGKVEALPPTDNATGGGIGLGFYGKKEGSLTINGGEVISATKNLSGGPFSAISKDLTFTPASGMQVKAGANGESATRLLKEERTTKGVTEKYAHVTPCEGHTYNYEVSYDGSYHTGTCIYCNHSFTEEHTIQGDYNTCTVCGYSPTGGTWSVALWTPQLEDGYCKMESGKPVYQTAPTTVFKDQPFHLPVCIYIPKGYAFAGWEVGQKISSLVAASDANLLQPGDSYTPTADVEFTARYRQLNITLSDNASDNDAAIWRNTGLTATSVTLQGRVLYKDGSWNTIFLPFDLVLEDSPLHDAKVKTLESTSFDESNGTLTLNFTEDLDAIEAGKPYIIKWEATTPTTIDSPIFNNVTINAQYNYIDADHITFVGMYNTYPLLGEDKSMLYLGASNKLYYPNGEMTISACRAFFQLNDITAGDLPNSDPSNGVRSFVLNFGEDNSTLGVATPLSNGRGARGEASWHALDGRRLSGKPTASGIYISNGRKMIVK